MKKIIVMIMCLVMALTFAACGSDKSSGDDSKDKVKSTYAQDGIALRVSETGSDKTKDYTVKQLKKLGLKTETYSGRNKKADNERQIIEYTGIDLKTVLKDAGFKNAKVIKITCADGYTNKYTVDEIYGLYAYNDKTTTKKKKVDPILTFIKDGEEIGDGETYSKEKGSPVRLIYGQQDYDTNDSKDFNIQGWAYCIEKIEVMK